MVTRVTTACIPSPPSVGCRSDPIRASAAGGASQETADVLRRRRVAVVQGGHVAGVVGDVLARVWELLRDEMPLMRGCGVVELAGDDEDGRLSRLFPG